MIKLATAALVLSTIFSIDALAANEPAPVIETCKCEGANIALRIFRPDKKDASNAAIVLFHGGGWTEGDASWMDGLAAQFAGLGLTAIAVDYRLSGESVSPFDAVADARNSIRWVRQQSSRLGVNPDKIAALGTSSGGHLAASAAVFNEPWGSTVSAAPDLLILRSPAISVVGSPWFRKLVGGAAQAAALSPVLHIRAKLPPTLILQGEKDNVTPAAEAELFCRRMQQAGNQCTLQIYPGVGHLFTRNLASQEIPDYSAIDAAVSREANAAGLAFLRKQGFLSSPAAP